MSTKEVITNTELNKFTNVAKVVGVISDTPVFSHSYDNENFYSVRVSVDTGSRVSVLHAYLDSKTLSVDGVSIDKGLRVELQGYLVQSKLKNLTDLTLRVVVAKLTNEDDYTAVYLSGTVIKESELIKLNNSTKVIKSIIIRHQTNIDGKDWRLTAKALLWNNAAKAVESNSILGSSICVRGYLISKDYTTDTNTVVTLHEINGLRVINL